LSDDPLLRVEELSVHFPARSGGGVIKAVDAVSFSINRGEILALVGETGSGKTTTGRAVLRLQKLASGKVELLGRDLTTMRRKHLREMRRHMQIVMQNPYSSLNPRMTVQRILAEPLRVHNAVPRSALRSRVHELLDTVGLQPMFALRYPHQLSGGQRQRVAIARAFAVQPDFVVCDEPVTSLDVRIQAQIVELLQSLQARFHLTYLFITHDLALVQTIAHRVAVMYRGQIVELATAEELYKAPMHPYTVMLLASVPIPEPRIQRERLAREVSAYGARVATSEDDAACRFGGPGSGACSALHEVSEGHFVSCRFWREPDVD
jgi:oligopeptide/dipeptide ABC transporter ATP-binding protein